MRKVGDSSVDVFRASKQGIIGGIGTIPGTLVAHPFDAVKILCQAKGVTTREALSRILFATHGLRGNSVPSSLRGLYAGMGAGIVQRAQTTIRRRRSWI